MNIKDTVKQLIFKVEHEDEEKQINKNPLSLEKLRKDID